MSPTRRSTPLALAALLASPGLALGMTINLDLNRDGGSATYSGVGVAPDTGTTWNSIAPADYTVGTDPAPSIANVLDSNGGVSTVSIAISAPDGNFNIWANNSNGNPTPVDLMTEYTYSNVYTVTISGLAPGAYDLYAFGQGDQDNQSGSFELAAANGGASSGPGSLGGDANFRDITRADGLGLTYHRLSGTVDGSGIFEFSTPTGGYINGFQLQQVPEPSVALLGALGVLGLARRRR